MSRWILIICVCLLLMFAGLLLAEGVEDTLHPGKSINCLECHTCETPTAREKCLRMCPSLTMTHITAEHSLSEAPEKIVLGEIADAYQPVTFDHKAHANMAEMGLKCATCHHYSPPGRIPACRECHGGEANPNNLRQPALKGAYHRHCISCHREWSHDTKCVICHIPAGKSAASHTDSTDIIGVAHPIITEPTKRIYHTPYKKGEIVTFYHRQHIELYGLRCANCHQEENCSYCHNLDKASGTARHEKTMEQIHATCNNCHIQDRCDKCHDTKEKPPFSHALTGWGLNRFHDKLDCRACHPTGKPISRLDRNCVNCHGGWSQENFDHAKTGLKLDDIHIEADCSDCHHDLIYDNKPVCSDCHDDDRSHTDAAPGVYLEGMKK
ncbi:MAG: cytochrome c3 family protein [Candidatus Zixiibacteriota bacterium]